MENCIYLKCYDCMNELTVDDDYRQMKEEYALLQLASNIIVRLVEFFHDVYRWIKDIARRFITVLKTSKTFRLALFHKKKRIRKKHLRKIKHF